MPIVPKTYLVDPDGQQWLLAVDNNALITTTAVAGFPAVSAIFLKDLASPQIWRLSILGAPQSGQIQLNAVGGPPSPTQLLVNSPSATLYAIQISNGLLQVAYGNACVTSFLNLRDALSRRLNDLAKIFWPDVELGLYIVEALRTWNALTATWNADFTFNIAGPTSVVWYDLSVMAGYPRIRTVTDNDLYTMMQYHLLEPATAGGVWTGSSQYALTDLVQALQRRRDETIQFGGTNLGQFSLGVLANQRRIIFSDDVLEVRRVRCLTPGNLPVTLWRDDGLGFQDFSPNYLQGQPSVGQQPAGPQQYNLTSNPPFNLDLDYPPTAGGTLDVVALLSGACPAPPAPSLLGVPDDLAWVIKWGALADLLGSDGERLDKPRADYCLQRYKDGILLAQNSPWLLLGTVNGVPYDTVSVTEMDQYSPEWDSNASAPLMLVQAGPDFVAVSPLPAGAATVGLTVLGNAPIPVADGDTVQATRDVLDAILDYAQHLAAFKQGGAEFAATAGLFQNFAQAATATNDRLTAIGMFRDVLLEEGRAQESAQERYTMDLSPEAELRRKILDERLRYIR